MRTLSPSVQEYLRSSLEARPVGLTALPFVEAVVTQRAWPLGEATPDAPAEPASGSPTRAQPASEVGAAAETGSAEEARVADQVIRMIDWSSAGDLAVGRVAVELVADLPLLAAFFQNLDLLPADGRPHTDAIAMVTVAAVQRLAETFPEG